MVLLVPAAVVVVVFVRGAFNYGETKFNSTVGQSIVADVQRDMFGSLIALDLARLNAVHSGQFVSNFLYDATLLREAVTKGIAGLGKEFLSLIFLSGVMIYQNWRLAMISVVVLPIIGYVARKLGKRYAQGFHASMEETGELSTVLAETLDGRRIVKAYGLEAHVWPRAPKNASRGGCNILIKSVRARALSVPLADFFGGVAIAGTFLLCRI